MCSLLAAENVLELVAKWEFEILVQRDGKCHPHPLLRQIQSLISFGFPEDLLLRFSVILQTVQKQSRVVLQKSLNDVSRHSI